MSWYGRPVPDLYVQLHAPTAQWCGETMGIVSPVQCSTLSLMEEKVDVICAPRWTI
jgi:hypothetical protein